MRLIALALLTLVSMGAAAKIDVQIAKFDGGTIVVKGQEEQKDGGVKVTITVSPQSGYTIKKDARSLCHLSTFWLPCRYS